MCDTNNTLLINMIINKYHRVCKIDVERLERKSYKILES